MTARTCAAVAMLGALLAGCGYKGPLTLPEDTGPVIIRPAPAAQPAAPATPATPAPQSSTTNPQVDPPPASQSTIPPPTKPETPAPPAPAPQAPTMPTPAPAGTSPGG